MDSFPAVTVFSLIILSQSLWIIRRTPHSARTSAIQGSLTVIVWSCHKTTGIHLWNISHTYLFLFSLLVIVLISLRFSQLLYYSNFITGLPTFLSPQSIIHVAFQVIFIKDGSNFVSPPLMCYFIAFRVFHDLSFLPQLAEIISPTARRQP